jgi:hypothetical protein
MPVPVTCSGCGAKMNAPDHLIGKRVACPKCKTGFVIPDPNAADGFEVVEEEPLAVAEVVDDDPPPAAAAKPASSPGVAKAAPVATASKKGKKPNARRKKQVDATDYLTKVNGKPIAVRDGEAPPPPIPRKSPPRD